jgi:hypothetical protein
MPNCCFCARRPAELTGEHVWSDWINKFLGPSLYEFTEKKLGKVTRRYKKKYLNLKIPVVCSPCNSGWMSVLENKSFKPVLKHMIVSNAPRSILPEGIHSLAKLAFKHSVIANHSGLEMGAFFTATERRTFAKSRRIPSGVYVWLGCLDTIEPFVGEFISTYGKTPPKTIYGMKLHTFTFGIGYFILPGSLYAIH